MLESIIRFAIKQRLIIVLMVLTIMGVGIWSATQLPVEAFPDVLNVTVQVITLAPGQAAADVERKITIPLEREFSGIPKVTQKRSISEFGLSVVYLYFDDNVDMYWARTQVMEKLHTAELPPGIQSQLAPMASVTGEILRYEVEGPGYTSTQLRTLQDWVLEKQFRNIPGIADVVGFGGNVRTWEVVADLFRLSTYGISIHQISDAIQNSNTNAGGNLISWPNQSFVVRSEGAYRNLNDVENVGISQKGNTIIRVKDLGLVKESHAPIRGVVGRDDRDDIVQGIILLRKGENPILVGQRLEAKIDELKHSTLLPEGVRIVTYYNRMELVDKTTHTVSRNLLEGLILVCIVLYIFLRNAYATALVAAIVPLSMLFAFSLMIFNGTPVNLISLGAIDFGIIVDGAVIIVEYVLGRHQQPGHTPQILDKTIAEVVRPVFFSMGIIILAYLPIFTLQQVEGKTFSPLAWTISFALLGALFLSLTLVPMALPFVIQSADHHPHQDPKWLAALARHYQNGLHWCLNQRRNFFIIVGILATLGIGVFLFSGSEFLPELDEGALWVRAIFPHSTSMEEGVKLAHQIRATFKDMPEVRTVVSQLGGPEDGTDPNLFDNCEFFVDLKPKESWQRFHHDHTELVRYVRDQLATYPGIEFNVSQPIADNVEEAISGVKGKNAAKIYGPDADTLDDIANQITTMIKSVPGTADVAKIATIPMVPHLTIRLDRTKLASTGLNEQDVSDLVEIAVGGKAVTQIYDGETRIDLVVRAGEQFRSTITDIRNLPLSLPNGARTTLDRVATVEMVDGPQVVYRENGFRRIGVKFDVEGRDLGSVMKDILQKSNGLQIPAGYIVKWGGEYENQKRAMARLLVVIPATLVLLGLVLFMLFENFGMVVAVIATLHISMVGSILLLFARGIPISVSAAVGLLALFGVVGLNGITLVTSYLRLKNENISTGNHYKEFLEQACRERFRPLLMTSVLAALGLMPAALSHGIGSETQRPLATAVIGGLLTGLPAVLFFLPVLLLLVSRFQASHKRVEEPIV